jgi:hypothetical protein
LTTVKKVAQRGLVAVVIMLPLILVFYSLGDAATQTVSIPCDGGDIDRDINRDPRDTASRFVLEADCTHDASATIVPSHGDEVVCAVDPTFKEVIPEPPTPEEPGPAYDPTTKYVQCMIAGCHQHDSYD